MQKVAVDTFVPLSWMVIKHIDRCISYGKRNGKAKKIVEEVVPGFEPGTTEC